uniref:Ig-like domain-containing protein n=1 Tax=Otus sunia TaxID=257818 RepID=A0A8C8BI41_9STRI
ENKSLLILSLKPKHILIQQIKLFSFPAIALFTVEVPQQLYIVEYGSNVTMECRFPVNAFPPSQHHDYIGRAALLHSELKLGRAILQITSVKITDAGSYLCLIDYQGVDYKYITLEVKAPYKKINTQVMRKPGEDKFVFMCQSEGFPLAEVFWQNAKNFNLSGSVNTTYTLTADGLYNVTSILTFKTKMSENYSCVFWNKELNAETSAHISTLGSYHLEFVQDGVFVQTLCPLIYHWTLVLENSVILEKKQVSIIYTFEASASLHSNKPVCRFSLYFNFRVAPIIWLAVQRKSFNLHGCHPRSRLLINFSSNGIQKNCSSAHLNAIQMREILISCKASYSNIAEYSIPKMSVKHYVDRF